MVKLKLLIFILIISVPIMCIGGPIYENARKQAELQAQQLQSNNANFIAQLNAQKKAQEKKQKS